jgi:putative ABC transport system ATP-binding protein
LKEASPALIALDGVSRIFDDGSVVALRGISMAVARGEFVSIVGPSGSGKTSLIHIMAGFDRPSAGRVLWQGETVSDRRAWTTLRRNKIGIVFQEFLLLPTLTAIENVEIAMSGTALAAPERRKRAAALLDQVGLGDRARHLPFALSGGERQRVAIARSLANRPELLLSDEPTGNLDSESAASVMRLLLALRADAGMTLVLVTHDMAVASLADRQVHIKDGRIDETATTGAEVVG